MDAKKGNPSAKMNRVKMKKGKREMWLMKVPTYLMDSWMATAAGGAELGRLVVTKTQDGKNPKMEFHLNLGLAGEAARSYSMTKAAPQTCKDLQIFSHDRIQPAMSFEGQVEDRFELRPVEGSQGGVKRTNQANPTRRSQNVAIVDEMPQLNRTARTRYNRKSDLPEREHRVREEDEGAVENMIFREFQKSPRLTLSQLRERTQQPPQFLQSILKRLCNKEKSGRSRAEYALKPEYAFAADGDE